MLECSISVLLYPQFLKQGNITFVLLKEIPHVENWWDTYYEQSSSDESGMFEGNPTWASFIDVVREQYYPVRNYDDQYIKYGPFCIKKGTRWC